MRITIGIVALIAVLATACTPSEPASADAPSGPETSNAAEPIGTSSVAAERQEPAPIPANLGITERVTSCKPHCAQPVIEAVAATATRVVVSSTSGTIAVLDNDGLVQLRYERRASAHVLEQLPPLNITVIASLPVSPVGERIHRPLPPGDSTPGLDR